MAAEILDDLGPAKSSKVYDKAWIAFTSFINNTGEPDEENYMQYLDFLAREKKYQASSLWCTFSKLNGMHQRYYGARLQRYPRIKLLIKKYEEGYTRTVAKVFTLHEIQAFMRLMLNGPYWQLRKAFVAVAYLGGLRCEESHKLRWGCLRYSDKGIFVNFTHAKQVGEQKTNEFLIPIKREDPSLCFASKVLEYIHAIRQAFGNIKDDEPLFFGCHGGEYFVRQAMGKRMLQGIGKNVAKVLSLGDPDRYTGHCWRRSSATEAANAGATTTDLKRQYGWKQETTAMRYLEKTEKQAEKMANLLTGTKECLDQGNFGTRGGQEQVGLPKPEANFAEKENLHQNVQYVYNITTGNNCTISF